MAKKGRKVRVRSWGGWPLAAALAVLLVAVAALLLLRPPDAAPLSPEGDPVMGRSDAPVTVYYYGDFQCPHCQRFELGGAFDRLEAGHVDAGEVRVVVKDFPILGDDSWAAAEASQFVWETAPESYWAWHRGLFERQGPERSGWASPESLVAYGATVPGVDAEGLRAALADHRHREEVRADAEQGRVHGVRSTPTLVIGGEAVSALDERAVEAAIARELAARRPA